MKGARIASWAQPAEDGPILFVHETCGHRCEPQVSCSACGEAIGSESVRAVGGHGGLGISASPLPLW